MVKIYETLLKEARKKSRILPPEVFILRGLWCTRYVLKLSKEASPFHLHYVLAQTIGQGCSYYDPEIEEVGLSQSFIGKNALDINTEYLSIKIATLDAVFASLKDSPSESHVIEGTNIEKDRQRSEIICNETLQMLKTKTPKNKHKMNVVNVGVVGTILAILTKCKNIEVKASDFYNRIVDQAVHGIKVEHGGRTLDLIRDADVAIVTGMTLANKTLDEILPTAREAGTALVVFAETGANFASEYCKMGVDVAISEPFPFYLSCPGRTTIDIYRRPSKMAVEG